jgi:hypothetical protein
MSFGTVSDSSGSIAGGESVSAVACVHTTVQKKVPTAKAKRLLDAKDMVFFSRMITVKPGLKRVIPVFI